MITYFTVKEIADILNTEPETVRRWIRNGKLKAKQETRKDGNLISSTQLLTFCFFAMPKYISIPLAIYAFNRSLSSKEPTSQEEKDIQKSIEQLRLLQKDIDLLEKEINRKEALIKQYQRQIFKAKSDIEEKTKIATDMTKSTIQSLNNDKEGDF